MPSVVDPSIPLSLNAAQPGFPQQVLSLQDMMLGLQQKRQQAQGQNALRELFANPASVDAAGNPTPEAMRGVMAIDPATGMALRQNQLKADETKAVLESHKTEAYGQKMQMVHDALDGSLGVYEESLKNGATPQAAQETAQRTYSDRLKAMRGSGLFSEQDMEAAPSQFNPMQARGMVVSAKDRMAEADKQQALERQDRAEREREKQDAERDAIMLKSINQRGDSSDTKGWTIMSGKTPDGKEIQYRIKPGTGEMTALNGAPFEPGQEPLGATKIGTGGVPRSGQTAAVLKFMEENPNATAEDISKFAAGVHAQSKATGDFATGAQGKAINSFNVAISHLNTMDQAAKALANGDMKMFNSLTNRVAEEFGVAPPTDFAAIRSIVGDEIAKSVIGSGSSALGDREEIKKIIDAADSPEQLISLSGKYRDLMAGQLRGLRQQYKQTTGKDDFDERLAPETRTQLGIGKDAKGAAPKTDRPASLALPPAFKDKPDGTILYDKDGFAYKKQGDKIELMK